MFMFTHSQQDPSSGNVLYVMELLEGQHGGAVVSKKDLGLVPGLRPLPVW